ncbi:MAG: Cobyrinic acid A,C-diamide synthase [uncultured Thiotrichaceae bacterium]|uniref:Cobyrinic acid A,C-diamide synthase n=1 Tax=uncultured Thiotrichaceae bacterium TaxID=298394 RepID=A0A6S6UGB8_9GAMM|nr:MAG: Cobyrinic acid A,C-diamide synthase [uncultured Thiotrichaceae bacterium]
MSLPRIYISAAHKSSGKTTLSIGLCAALTAKGLNIQPFKKGPDYIDPLWLGAASGNQCYNLDFNTQGNDEILSMFGEKGSSSNIIVTEGNLGLYDGTDVLGSNSNAAMAKLTKSPVILVIDAQGVSRGVAPLLVGYQQFDQEVNIAGVIFNKVRGDRHAKKLRDVVEYYTDIPIIGSVQQHNDLMLVERHLGLMPYNETAKAMNKITHIRDQIVDQVDIEAVTRIANVNQSGDLIIPDKKIVKVSVENVEQGPLKIGICRDEAFGFYYPDDLESFEREGCELVEIDCLNDQELPEIDGLFIGGGFPETKLAELSENYLLRQQIHDAIEQGLPTYAECGGLMYLANHISWMGDKAEMVGVIPGDAVLYKRPQGRGYIEVSETKDMLWSRKPKKSETIHAHEFHYSKLENLTKDLTEKGRFAYSVQRGTGIDGENDGWVYKNLLASYAHMRNTEENQWVSRFIDFVRKQIHTDRDSVNS